MNVGRYFLFWVIWIALSAFLGEDAPTKVKEGNRLYKEKKYAEALSRYHEAHTLNPDRAEIPFNIGNGFYRQERFPEARKSHEEAIRLGSGPLVAKAYYNIGNSLYREGNLEGALEAYKKAIDMNPSDQDTKYNIEFIQQKLKEKMQQKPESQSQEEKEQKQQEEESEGGGGEGEKGKEEKTGGISESDAERLLDALQEEENPLPSLPKGEEKKKEEAPVIKDW